jgi:hypothetical protein
LVSLQRAINANRYQRLVHNLATVCSGGWPLTAYISVTTRKGSGLADAITHPLNSQIAIAKSETNSPALAAH